MSNERIPSKRRSKLRDGAPKADTRSKDPPSDRAQAEVPVVLALAEAAIREAEQVRRVAEETREAGEHGRKRAEVWRQGREQLREVAETARAAGEEARLAPERPRYAGSGRQISSALSYEH